MLGRASSLRRLLLPAAGPGRWVTVDEWAGLRWGEGLRQEHTVSHVRLTPQGVQVLHQQHAHDANQAPSDGEMSSDKQPLLELQRPSAVSRLRAQALAQVRATFLPVGYPSSVRDGYLPFLGWQAAHHVASSANGVLASAGLLYGLGYGGDSAAAAGALSWVLKDGLGQLGTLIFGRFIAQDFDVHARRWYLAASVKLNVAVLLELATMLAPATFFLPAASAANGLKGLAWMAGGSARAVFNNSFAARANLADITAKATSQAICAGLVGTAGGIGLAAAIGQDGALMLAAATVISVVHMVTSWQSVRSVPLTTLNPVRLHALGAAFIRAARRDVGYGGEQHNHQPANHHDDEVPPSFALPHALPLPAESAKQEPLWPVWATAIPVGVSPRRLRRLSIEYLRTWLLPAYGKCQHMLVDGRELYAISSRRKERGYRRLLLHERATSDDVLLACLHFCLAQADDHEEDADTVSSQEEAEQSKLVKHQLREARRLFPEFKEALIASGWDIHQLKVENTRHRAVW